MPFLAYASDFSGDGTHEVKKGDVIKLDNGWKVEIIGIFWGYSGEEFNFKLFDPKGKEYPGAPFQNTVSKPEVGKKFGTDSKLKVEIKSLELLGKTSPTGSPLVKAYEKVRVNIASIDESLPKMVTSKESKKIEEVNKTLTYKNGKKVVLKIGDETTLGNGYKLKLDSFDQRWSSPYFSFYNSQGKKIDEYIGVGKGVGTSLGSYVHVNDYGKDSVDLTIIDGSKVTFGTGWNLFSIYMEDGDGYGTVLESTCNQATMWGWNNSSKNYENLGNLKEGGKIPAGKGVWVKIQTKKNTISDIDCEILVSGKKSVTTSGVKLKAGWNLIGAPISAYGQREEYDGGSNFNRLNFSDILGDCKIDRGPWQFLATIYTHTSIVSDLFDTRKFSKPFENKLRLNRGYFIKVANDCVLKDK